MKAAKRALDPHAIRWATGFAIRVAREQVDAVHAFEADSESTLRLAKCECKTCFYLRRSRVGGAAMTTWYCGVCGREGLHGSTATPRACIDCAKEHSLCSHCGGDLEMRDKRRKFPPLSTSAIGGEDA